VKVKIGGGETDSTLSRDNNILKIKWKGLIT
jgi:hypothetical protein